jgi:DNA-binding SARP family transcriptional activator
MSARLGRAPSCSQAPQEAGTSLSGVISLRPDSLRLGRETPFRGAETVLQPPCMDFRILGPLEVWDRGCPLELRRQKQRTLLAALLLRVGEVVSVDQLIDDLWGERPPSTARASVHNAVSAVRKVVGHDTLRTRGSGYVLDIAPEQLDLSRFERLTAEARGADGKERLEKLREALALWRGPPLADLVFEPMTVVEAVRLEELRTAALEDLIDAELSLGAGAELVEKLETLVAEHPFREHFRGQLMLALYRSGRQAEALEAYQDARRVLVGELGIEPSTPLRQLEQAILRQDVSLSPADIEEAAARPEERRKTVTVLIADLSFAQALDPEVQRELTRRSLTTVRTVLEAHGATIEQRAGDQVLAVFGVPASHEDDPLRAARAALELKAEIAPRTAANEREPELPIELRVGIDTGEVLAGADEAGHGLVAGPAITLAKRLQQLALGGEILAGAATLQLLGDAVVAEPADRPRTDAFRILKVVEGVPMLARHLEAPLVGRRTELAALRESFERCARQRRCSLHLILGEAGIGKTRLATEFTAELDGSTTILVGRCVSYGKGATFLPLGEIVSGLQARTDLQTLFVGDQHAELIVTRLAELTEEENGSSSSSETFWAVRRLLETLAGHQPVLLVLEDLHWAEPTLLDLIDYVTEQLTGRSVLLLGLARPELLEERPEWAQVETTGLAPLSTEEGEALIDNLAEIPATLRAQIVRTAGGNPLFLEQLLAHVTEGSESERLPPSLELLLASRLDRLAAAELATLQRAAVVGREFPQAAVAHLSGEAGTAAVASLPPLVRKGLIEKTSAPRLHERAYRFHHALICEAAYATLPKAQRAELHERFARWLDASPTGSDELVGFHLERAHRYLDELDVRDVSARGLGVEAGERLAAAGLRSAKRGDLHAAADLLGRASSLLDAREVARRDLLTELGLVLWRSGDVAAAEQMVARSLETALAEHDGRAELRARIELANLKLARAEEGGADELVSLASRAIPTFERLGDDRALARAWFALATVHGSFHCRYQRSTEAAGRALGHFRRSGWPLAPCLQDLAAGLYYGPTPVLEAISRCQALLEEADRGGQAHILTFMAGLEAMGGRFDSARELTSMARSIYDELAWTLNLATNYAPLAADIEFLAGNFPEAEFLLSESCRTLEASGEQARLATQAAQLGEAVQAQRRHVEALRWSEVAEGCAVRDDTGAQFSWRALRAKALAHQGALSEAQRMAQEAVALAAATDTVNQHAQVLLGHADVLRLAGRAEQGTRAIEDAIRLLDEKGNLPAGRQARTRLAESSHA